MRIRLLALLVLGVGAAGAFGLELGRRPAGFRIAPDVASSPDGDRSAKVAPALAAAANDGAGLTAVPAQGAEYYPYDGRWTFVRIQTNGGLNRGGFGRRRGGGLPGWAHDYPDADRNFSKILNEITFVNTRLEAYGGNILTFDDPRLSQFPAAYISEPGQWSATASEIDALRSYLLKGGFLMFDDFGGYDMYNLAEQMKLVMPELDFMRLDLNSDVFDVFFQLDPDNLSLSRSAGSYRGTPEFYGLFVDNDPAKRMIAIAANNGDFGEFWEFSDRGFYPIDISNEAYKVGVNYVVYALTH